MKDRVRRYIARQLVNYKGWRTDRKIVVIESDDWGSIRMPSKSVYKKFLKKGIPVDKSPYLRYDSLASEEDLEALFETLSPIRDHRGNHPVITANTIVANPDFEKIKETGYKEYYYERFTDTLQKYPAHEGSFLLWEEGQKAKIFHPQFHGREHLNVPLWLGLLQNNHKVFLEAFNDWFWGLDISDLRNNNKSVNIQAALDSLKESDSAFHEIFIREGLEMFEQIFGFFSKSFIAPNYTWDTSINDTLYRSGVRYIQSMKMQKLPLYRSNNRRMIRRYMGEENQYDQTYMIRNCVFEPSITATNYDDIGNCLKDITNAFFWKKPAIITSHRLNYIGYLDQDNRNTNLIKLNKLVSKVIKKWPDVEFMTSDQLGNYISNN